MSRPPDSLRMIYLAIVSGVALFGLVTVWLMGGSEPTGASWGWIWIPGAALAVFATGFLRGRLRAEGDAARRRTLAIVLWATAEGAAFIGLVVGLVTGSWAAALGGLTVGLGLLVYHGPGSLT